MGLLDTIKRNAKSLLTELDPRTLLDFGQGQTLQEAMYNRMQPGSLRPNLSPEEMVNAGLNIAGVAPIAHTVYHGSPHKFNKFDMSKIGTGEGAQAYGHGLYFAENPGIAKHYMDALAPHAKMDAKTISELQNKLDESQLAYDNWIKANTKKFNDMKLSELQMLPEAQAVESSRHELNQAKSWKKRPELSNLYKVDIPDEAIPRMLDWDKPLSEQSKYVQDIVNAEIKRIGGSASDGERVYKELMFDARMNGKASESGVLRNNIEQVSASDRLKELGIPGIRYLDGSSRTAGDGTSNFVLFDDQMPRILEVNGQPTGLLSYADEAKKAKRPVNHLGQEIPPTKYELAHEEAQRVAALPVEQGGLGLPPNNTAMDRAKAMWIDTDAYHGTHGDIEKFYPNPAQGGSVFTSPDKQEANNFAFANGANVLPLKIGPQNTMRGVARSYNELTKANAAYKAGKDSYLVTDSPGGVINTAILDPARIRSRFAAFNPAMRDSSDLLAGVAPYAIPAIGAGLLGATIMPNEAMADDKKKKKK